MAKRLVLFFLLLLLLSLVNPGSSLASSLVKIDKNGEVLVNVLSYESSLALGTPPKTFLEIKEVAGRQPVFSQIALREESGKYNLYLGEKDSMDVSNWRDSIVEIEENEENKKAEFLVNDGKFAIRQEGILADISYPIKLQPKERRVLIETPFGDKFLSILPYDAALIALRAKAVFEIDKSKPFELIEENKDLVYKISGNKVLNIFNVYRASFPVVAKVSASTGEVVLVDEPWWLKVIGVFLS
ncbi:MAG: hypothetical protein KatS3mg088_090 [Patescibacteria group bacterium]|nr:MAG: hypothetical protein KatS3mg088_090 [Patescibacteria group bacterium]